VVAASAAERPVSQPRASGQYKLSAAASPPAASHPTPANVPRRQPRPPKTGNPVLKYAVIGALLLVVVGAGYRYLPGLLNQVQETGTSKAPAGSPAGGGTGPLGEVNGAMDVSDALDGGSASKPRPGTPKHAAAVQRPATSATNLVPKSAHSQ